MLIEKRLDSCYRDLLSGIVGQQTTTVKHIARGRAEQVRFGRFLRNEKLTPELILKQATASIGDAVAGIYILLVEDSSEISFGLMPRATGLGGVGTGAESGFFLHPVLAVDAAERACYGLAAAKIFKRAELPADLQGAGLKARRKY